MSKKDSQVLAEIVRRNMLAAKSADNYRSLGDVHQSLMRQVAYDLCGFCASRNERFNEATFLVACGIDTINPQLCG